MDFQKSPPVHHHQQKKRPIPHSHGTMVASPTPSSPQPHQQEQQQPPLHGHGTMEVPQLLLQSQTHQQEQTNTYNLPAKIIFHQPQQQKKRGRSKKSFADCLDSGVDGDVTSVSSSVILAKKPIGRSLCSENKQKQEAPGAVESRWTQHLISVHIGEDIIDKLTTFSQHGPRPWVVCIMSATGVVCSVKLQKSAIGGETVTYEGGQFGIISLSGSLFLPDSDDSLGISGGLSVLLSRPDGSNFGGIVAGMLKASSPVELVVASFVPKMGKPMHEAPSSTC